MRPDELKEKIAEDGGAVDEMAEGGLAQPDTDVNAQGNADIKAFTDMADGMIADSRANLDTTLDMIDTNTKSQMEVANENTEFTIDQIEQEKAKAKEDYTKEQSAAYADYQKATSKHGVNAEQMAANGLTDTGYSETAKVAMYNQYQQRVAVARSSYNQAVTDYNNAMTTARLQNNSVLAEMAAQAFEKRVTATLTFVQEGNDLLKWKAETEYSLKRASQPSYMDVLGEIEGGDLQINKTPGNTSAGADESKSKGNMTKTAVTAMGDKTGLFYNFLVKHGYGDALDGMLTPEQWAKDKTAGSGTTFNSYEEYVKTYIAWVVSK